jgi:hypothetical protein
MKLYLVHCGFYDASLNAGTVEGHTNFWIAAPGAAEARARAKGLTEFRKRKMHVDVVQEIRAVEGYAVILKPQAELHGKTLISLQKYGSPRPKLVEL